jgi:hypothetical protein
MFVTVLSLRLSSILLPNSTHGYRIRSVAYSQCAALVLSLCRHLRDKFNLAVVTNDIFTKVSTRPFQLPTSIHTAVRATSATRGIRARPRIPTLNPESRLPGRALAGAKATQCRTQISTDSGFEFPARNLGSSSRIGIPKSNVDSYGGTGPPARQEDCEFLTRNEALPAERISCLGGCLSLTKIRPGFCTA